MGEPSRWWEGFFEGAWQAVQLGLFSEEETRAQVDRIERALGLSVGSRVLDVPCGEGRIALELAARGHRVTGIDITEAFLAEARRKAQERGLAAEWRLGDMRDLPWEAEFDAAVNFGGSFGYFDDGENRRFVEAVSRSLKPGGQFLIEGITPETVLPRFRDRQWFAGEGVLVLTENRFDHETGRIEGDWTIVLPDGERESRHSSMRIYTYHELTELLPFSLKAGRLTMVATKGRERAG